MFTAPARTGRRFRPEVQGLRAVAVLLVLVYHLNPALLPGGYVGVDVFFVISGFLITSLLYREAGEHGRVSISGFYVRRVRRLLPAATTVLLTTGVVAFFVLPVTRLADTAWQLVASAAYVENLYLARQAVDYLASDTPPSPVQHFWSLSVEEQFYLVWPLLFVAWSLARRRWRAETRTLVVILGSVLVLSLACSVLLTQREPASAYFLPLTRAWELAVGGLLAVGLAHGSLPERWRPLLGWSGLAAVAVSALAYDDGTPFPGWAAALPVLGSAAVIAAEQSDGRLAASRLLGTAPARWIGDLSYSLYLWHWPLIVFALVLTGRDRLGLLEAVTVAALSVLLAWGTRVWVEDPVRDRNLVRGGRSALTVATAGVVTVAAVGGAVYLQVDREGAVSFDPAVHTGPAALGQAPDTELIYPSPVNAEDDVPTLYDDDCQASRTETDPGDPCVYGPEDADTDVAVVGDSHSAQWVPALEKMAAERGWRIFVYTKSSCAFTDTVVKGPEGGPYTACGEWNHAVVDELDELRPELVFTSSSTASGPVEESSPEQERAEMAEGMSRLWEDVAQVSGEIVALRDTPRARKDVVECVATHIDDPSRCERPVEDAFDDADPQEDAARSLDERVHWIDLSDRFCVDGGCPAVIGNVMVYRDAGHITSTYAELLADDLSARIDRSVRL
ncbi:peptidoglycan/LPS O-acetylase OafA/YrhL [Nocardiopsis arvandica]|uniref:Peptidoglycan/LPS O-acetylase OafA/YrhL n=1 Tax=Nocardiopsis sinuspersici TaxID=501010 RepID=A0A7Y9XDV5_9ACTN|nr:acyltransferase family protein [Nocardiopsis sinuspersici]NYH53996.1 peptidoglycan/LPS O-acetylase OafA/YrhL [Nocardiopsis sinuspersici]